MSASNVGDTGLIPGLGKSPGEGNGNPLQYSCLENPMDGGAWWATVHGVAKSLTRLSDFTFFLRNRISVKDIFGTNLLEVFKNVFYTFVGSFWCDYSKISQIGGLHKNYNFHCYSFI